MQRQWNADTEREQHSMAVTARPGCNLGKADQKGSLECNWSRVKM